MRIVGHVTSTAQDRAHRSRQLRGQAARDEVEHRRPPGRQRDLRGAPEAFRVALPRHLLHGVHPALDHDPVGVAVAGDAKAFEALDAGKADRPARRDGARELHGLVDGTAAGAPSGDTNFQQCVQRPRRTAPFAMRFDQLQLRDRIDQDVQLQVRHRLDEMHRQQDVLVTDELIGENDAAQAHAHAHAHLLHRRERDAPGARFDLAREELRRHRRLAVRGEQHAGGAREVRHPREVVGQRRLFQHRHGEWQVAPHDIPAPTADIPHRARRRPVRISLETGIERRGFDRPDVDHMGASHRR